MTARTANRRRRQSLRLKKAPGLFISIRIRRYEKNECKYKQRTEFQLCLKKKTRTILSGFCILRFENYSFTNLRASPSVVIRM
jgi:hypothetical protein